MKQLCITLLVALFALNVAATNQNDSIETLMRTLGTPDYNTGAFVIVHQDAAIYALFHKKTEVQMRETKGFRVQIYSSNRGAKARNRAYEIKDEIEQRNSNLDVYVTYTAPFWKVRIGNCTTEAQAKELRAKFIEQFPEYQTETYVVPSNILIQ